MEFNLLNILIGIFVFMLGLNIGFFVAKKHFKGVQYKYMKIPLSPFEERIDYIKFGNKKLKVYY